MNVFKNAVLYGRSKIVETSRESGTVPNKLKGMATGTLAMVQNGISISSPLSLSHYETAREFFS